MPPPPPPSKSYLLKFDDDSDDDDDSDVSTASSSSQSFTAPTTKAKTTATPPPQPPPQQQRPHEVITNPIWRLLQNPLSSGASIPTTHSTTTDTTTTNHNTNGYRIERSGEASFSSDVVSETRQDEIVEDDGMDDDENEDDDEDDDEEEDAKNFSASSGNSKNSKHARKKRGKKKGKKKKRSKKNNNNGSNNNNSGNRQENKLTTTTTTNHNTTTAVEPPLMKRAVSFGSVSVHEFGRCLGTDSVPGDGGWPLGLDVQLLQSQEKHIDEYEQAKQERLRQRWEEWARNSSLSSSSSSLESASLEPPPLLETRPYDYKRGERNPLFRHLHEKERMQLLLDYSAASANSTAANSNLSNSDHGETISTSASSKAPGATSSNNHRRTGRARSNSTTSTEEIAFNATFTQNDVHHVRHELETVRNQRSMEGSLGCTCRKLFVYLPPPGTAVLSKKAQKQRMALPKVKEELRKRHLLPAQSNKTREELERLLYDAVEQEPCCTEDCFCVRNHINCQADACTCWLASHHKKQQPQGQADSSSVVTKSSAALSNAVSVEEIQARCGNKYGMYTVDLDAVSEFRQRYLQLCHEVGTPFPAVTPAAMVATTATTASE